MVTLENALVKACIHPKGAELQSLYHKENNLDYLWDGNPAYWGKHSPVLFPIVGGLKNNEYHYKGGKYSLGRHGFARDLVFEKEKCFGDSASFVLESSPETLSQYPFDFLLRIKYQLNANSITIGYEVENRSAQEMLFSIGSHPAFKLPLVRGTSYHDYYLEFDEQENSVRWSLDNNLIGQPVPFLQNQSRLPLKPELFYDDALVFKHLKSSRVALCSDKTHHGIHVDFKGFPYLGIWAAKDAPFVCIEPWCGIADSVSHNQNIEEKEGIIKIETGEKWSRSWRIAVF